MARILIVENELPHAKAAELSCTADGHTTAIARHGTEAMVRLAREPFDMVLVDGLMPGREGVGLIAALRAHPAYRALPIVVLTANPDPQAHAQLLAMGADRVLPKAYQPGDLCRAIGDLRGQP